MGTKRIQTGRHPQQSTPLGSASFAFVTTIILLAVLNTLFG